MNEMEPQSHVFLAAGVAGCFPEYLEAASDLSLNALAVPERLWRFFVNNSEQWTTVSSFWRQVGKSKNSIILATNPGLIATGGMYAMELEFLRKLGYSADQSGTRLDFGSGLEVVLGKTPKISLSPIQVLLRKFFPRSTFRERMRRALKPDGTDPELEEKVRQGLRFLFRNLPASIVSNHRFPRAFGNAVLVVAADTVLMRVVRDRDELRFDVASANSPKEWRPLPVALAAVQGNAQNPVLASRVSIHQSGALLEAGFEPLRAAFSPEKYPITKTSMQEIERTKRDEWVEKFNRSPAVSTRDHN